MPVTRPPSPELPFAELPFAEQLVVLDARVVARESLAALVTETAQLADHQAFAELVRRLLSAGLLDDGEVAEALGEALKQLPATGIQRLLRTLAEDTDAATKADTNATTNAAEATARNERFIAIVAATLPKLPVSRVAAICLLDRWLKNEAPAAREALSAAATARVVAALDAADPDAGHEALASVDDATLLAVPTKALASLASQAARRGLSALWDARRAHFAATVLKILEAQPKSLSQANAEQLLARRVYTDPGHFFVELLQNADDARATRWHVTIFDDRVTIWHDGAPFDAKDVVGVLSIGQTTKAADQIGLFGVGFKSVYEICERPQIFSEPFSFEIADVSMPRRLARRPAGAREDGTLLILPFRGGPDPSRAEALEAKALAVAAQTLLTLRALRELVVIGPTTTRRARAETRDDGRVWLHIEEEPSSSPSPSPSPSSVSSLQTQVLRYLVARDRFVRPDETAPSGSARTAEILVAVALDEAGWPKPLAPSTPTVFAFLPTSERSGLRVLVHAPFVLPVDRERLDPTAPFNHWALARAGELLARLVSRWADAAQGDEAGDLLPSLTRMLTVLPLTRELAHPGYEVLVQALTEALDDRPCLPGADGGALTPQAARLCADDALSEVLAAVTLDEAGGRALAPLAPRELSLARQLGAGPFDLLGLSDLLQRHLGTCQDGMSPEAPWLRGEALDRLLAAIARLVARLPAIEREAAIARLAALPLWPAADGTLHRAGALSRGPRHLRALYGPSRALLAPQLDPPADVDLQRLLSGLAMLPLDDARLLADLGDAAEVATLLKDRGDSLGLARVILEAIARLSPADRRDPRVARAAVFLDAAGQFYALVGDEILTLGPGGPLELWLREHVSGTSSLRLCHPAIQADHGAMLVELGAQRLSLISFLTQLQDVDAPLAVAIDDEAWRALYRLLADDRDGLTPREVSALVKTPLFVDRAGRRRSLVGEDAVLLPADAAIVTLAPQALWLGDDDALLALAKTLVPPVGAEAVARTLLLDANTEPLFDPFADTARLRRAYRYLRDHADSLPMLLRRRLEAAPIWLDEGDTQRSLARSRRLPDGDPAADDLTALYRAWRGDVSLIDVDALALAEALDVADAIPRIDHAQWVSDLGAADDLSPLLDDSLRPKLLAALDLALTRLDEQALSPLRDAPLFLDEAGVARPLGSWAALRHQGSPRSSGDHTRNAALSVRAYVVEERDRALFRLGTWPLVAAEVSDSFATIIAGLGVSPAELDDLLDALEEDPALTTVAAATEARVNLAARAVESEEALEDLQEQGARLTRLPIWPGSDGTLHPSAELIDPSAASRVLGGAWKEVLADAPYLADEALSAATRLRSCLRFRDPLEPLIDRLRDEGRVGEPLSAQAALFSDPERLLDLLEIVARRAQAARRDGEDGDGNDDEASSLLALPLLVDARGCLARGPLVRGTDDEIALLAGTALGETLCDAAFAQAASRRLDPRSWEIVAPPLSLRRLLTALADACREASPAAACHAPPLSQSDLRARLYRMLLSRAEAIAADVQAKGVLGRAHVFIDRGGILRSPRELLLISPRLALPHLDVLDAQPAEEIPAELLAWIAATYVHDAHQVERVLEPLLDLYDEAYDARDELRAVVLLETMAQTLRVGQSVDESAASPKSASALHNRTLSATELDRRSRPSLHDAVEALPTRIKLHRRLRVPCADKRWRRPRALVLVSAEDSELLRLAFASPPPSPSAALAASPLARALLEGIGAHASLDAALLRPLFDESRRHGADAAHSGANPYRFDPKVEAFHDHDESVALRTRAHLIVKALGADPSLVSELALDRRAWLPDGAGHLCAPRDLYWPDARAQALLGDRPSLYPSAEMRFAAPAALFDLLPFRALERAALEDVIDTLRITPPANVDQLRWLEEGLAKRRIDAAMLREELRTLPCLRDDLGITRAPQHLCRRGATETFGPRRGDFDEGRRYRRLTAALGIPSRPGPRQAADFLAEIAALLTSDEAADRLLSSEGALLDTLPRSLGLWARRPTRLLPSADEVAIAALRRVDHAPRLCRASDDRLDPEASAAVALDPIWPDEDVAAARAFLGRLRGELSSSSRETSRGGRSSRPASASRGDRGAEARRAGPELSGLGAKRSSTDRPGGDDDGLVARFKRWWHGDATERGGLPGDEAARETSDGDARDRGAEVETRAERRRRVREERKRRRELARARREADDHRERLARERERLAREREAAREERERQATRAAQEQRSRHRPHERSERSRSRRRPPTPRRDEAIRPLSPGGAGSLGGRSSARPSAGEAPPEQRAWFRPRESIDEQLSGPGMNLADRGRAPAFGFSHAPSILPAPWLYAPRIVSGRFDATAQRWLPVVMPAAVFGGGDDVAGEVRVRGRVPAGEILLPVPAFSRVSSVSGEGVFRKQVRADGQMLLVTEDAQEISYTLALASAPAFDSLAAGRGAQVPAPAARDLLAFTTDDDDLPEEILDAVADRRDALARGRERPLDVALGLRDLVRQRYRYDPTYLEDPQVARWLRAAVSGRRHMHIAALHAGRDARHLGRGVCYELNALLCELLRRAGIPAAVASGWTFDRGSLAEPDHLWALALLPSPAGPRFCPVDASTTRVGRPLHAERRPTGRWRAPDRGRAPEAPAWTRASSRGSRGSRGSHGSHGSRGSRGSHRPDRQPGGRVASERLAHELAVVLRFLDDEGAHGAGASDHRARYPDNEDRQAKRLARAEKLLDDPAFVSALRRLLDAGP